MPDTLTNFRKLSPASAEQRKRWAGLLWTTIDQLERGQTPYWTGQQLRLVAEEIQPPLQPNGDEE